MVGEVGEVGGRTKSSVWPYVVLFASNPNLNLGQDTHVQVGAHDWPTMLTARRLSLAPKRGRAVVLAAIHTIELPPLPPPPPQEIS